MSSISFDPVLPATWLIVGFSVMIILFSWQEARRPYPFRWLRVLAQVVALVAVLGLFLRPSWPGLERRTSIALLTPGYLITQVDSLRKADPSVRFVRAPGAKAMTASDSVASYRELSQVGEIGYVLGDGIPVPFLETVNQYQYLPGEAPTGVVEFNTGAFPANRRNWIHGMVRGVNGGKLVLQGPGGIEDSVRIRKEGETPFDLSFVTKAPGRYVYSLKITDASGSRQEEVPIEVVQDRVLSILILQTYPQAEARFLKNFLTAKGHRLVTRYQLSKNTFRHEFANGPTEKVGMLTAGALGLFDLVITDAESLDHLSGNEVRELEESVAKGVGLLMMLHGTPDRARFPGNRIPLELDANAPDTISYNVGRFGSFVSPFVAAKATARTQVILRSGQYALQGFVLAGEGKVGFSALRETYQLGLGGDNSAYAALWTPLLEQVARREEVPIRVQVSSSFPGYPDEPLNVEVIGGENLSLSDERGTRIPLAEDVRIDNLWCGRFWPSAAGWAKLSTGDSTQFVFVSKPGAWPSVRVENQRRANSILSVVSTAKSDDRTVREPISKWWFLITFLLGMGVVWMGPKV